MNSDKHFNPYKVLGIKLNSNKDEIKKAYYNIALSCHPDKLNDECEKEKDKKIELFKDASKAYQVLMNNDDNINLLHDDWEDEIYNWRQMFPSQDVVNEIFVGLATMFKKSKIRPRKFYNPSVRPKKEHKLQLKVSYKDVLKNVKKRLRLILTDIDEPIFIDIFCSSYPRILREYVDDDNREHDIIIDMDLIPQDKFDKVISPNGGIDIVTTIEIDLVEYITGCKKEILYIDDNIIDVYVPPFHYESSDILEIPNKGLNSGALIIKLILKNFTKSSWNRLSENDNSDMLRILRELQK